MKNILILVFILSSFGLFAQQNQSEKPQVADTSKTVSFITNFNERNMACKDGYAIEGYIVNIAYNEAKKLDGKKIKITGRYTIVPGLENQPKQYDQNGNEFYKQGRRKDTKHIGAPVIEIVGK